MFFLKITVSLIDSFAVDDLDGLGYSAKSAAKGHIVEGYAISLV